MEENFNDGIIKEFRASGGSVGGMFSGMELLLLTAKGAKSGAERTTPLAYTRDNDDYVIIASYGGAAKHPAWFHNLKANPDVTVEVGTERFAATAHIAGPTERERLFKAQAAVYPQFNEYQKKTTREIPVVVLKRH